MTEYKCVIIIDEDLPTGIIANSSAALSMSIGKAHPELVGHDLIDNEGFYHKGITQIAIPILKGSNKLHAMRQALKEHEADITIIDLIDATNSTASYDDYAKKMQDTPVQDLVYYGIALYGEKKIINKLTGSLGLIR